MLGLDLGVDDYITKPFRLRELISGMIAVLRRREIAMLKSVGLTPGGFLRMLRYESLFYGLTALLYGLPIGIALSFLIYKQFGGVIYFAFSLPWWAIAATVLGILAIVFATMMVSGAMIRNDNIVDTIKEENL